MLSGLKCKGPGSTHFLFLPMLIATCFSLFLVASDDAGGGCGGGDGNTIELVATETENPMSCMRQFDQKRANCFWPIPRVINS